jgi:uncharacterized repeat protein (TIGR03899 family)
MATGWEMLPDTAKALSKPIEKLIDAIASGCGKAYGPTDIRRTAKAQADAEVILAEAAARKSEIAQRAAHRLLQIEETRQRNIDAIAAIAASQLPEEVSDTPVEQDWATRFFREAQDISDEQMRQLWGKLLAGEVAKPGSFSMRTLSVVSNLSPTEATKFGEVCGLICKIHGQGLATFLSDTNSPYVKSRGLSFVTFKTLEAAGLVNYSSFNITARADAAKCTFNIERPGNLLLIATGELANVSVGELKLGKVSLTPAGEELFEIAEWFPSSEYDEEVIRAISACHGWKVEKQLIIGRSEETLVCDKWPEAQSVAGTRSNDAG